jgi:uncharacterized protein with ParB-like and HNH nuclease domain
MNTINTNEESFLDEFDEDLHFSDEEQIYSEEKTEEDSSSDEIDPSERKLHTQAYDKSVGDLITMIDDEDIFLNPSYQRSYIWSNRQASLLVESILLNVPIPVLYMAEDHDAIWNVVDGLQRLNSLNRFLKNEFRLVGLDVLKEFNRKNFQELTPKAQRILKKGIIRTIVISNDSHHEIKFDIFMRLNRGSIKLNEQELRNCLYRGNLNEALKEWRKNDLFKKMIGLKSPHKRFIDAEIILRFLAISENYDRESQELKNYSGQMKNFLNNYMENHHRISQENLAKLESKFTSTVDKVFSIFGEDAFRKIKQEGIIDPRLNRAIHDCLMISFEDKDKNILLNKKEEIISARETLMLEDKVFYDAISSWTSDKTKLNYRIQAWNKKLNHVLQ